MARRPSGLKPPRGTLGTLIRTTLQQAGAVRDAIASGAREGRSRLDDVRSNVRSGRRRQEALAELGELVLGLIRAGEIDLGELPEAQELVRQLDELDASDESGSDAPPTARSPRSRFDDRGETAEPGRRKTTDGTVSSSTWAPPSGRAGRPTTVWRPSGEPATSPLPPTDPGRKGLPRDPQRKGGIQFASDDDDEELAEYMHPDDVPAKPPTDGDA